MENKAILERINDLEKLIIVHTEKKVLTLEEVAAYTGLSKSYLYKLTCTGEIPHYKPRSKMIYFNKEEINDWLLQNRSKSKNERDQEAATFVNLKMK